jgi:hypothetical protein
MAGCLPTPVRTPEGRLRRGGAVQRGPFAGAKLVFGVESHAACTLPAREGSLCGEGNGSRSTESAGELGEDRQVGVQPNPIQTTASLFAVRPSDGNGRCTAPGRKVWVKEIEDNSRILIDWGDDDETTTVEFRFVPYGDDASDVRVTETGHTGDGNEVAARAADSTGGFTFMVCALKALLEHDVVLTVVLDAHPQGLQL